MKVINKKIFIVIAVIFMLATKTFATPKETPKSLDSVDNSIYNAITILPEFIKFLKHNEQYSNEAKVSIMIMARPSTKEPYFWVQVGINDEVRFTPYFNFIVYVKKNIVIKYFDTMTDKIISLKK